MRLFAMEHGCWFHPHPILMPVYEISEISLCRILMSRTNPAPIPTHPQSSLVTSVMRLLSIVSPVQIMRESEGLYGRCASWVSGPKLPANMPLPPMSRTVQRLMFPPLVYSWNSTPVEAQCSKVQRRKLTSSAQSTLTAAAGRPTHPWLSSLWSPLGRIIFGLSLYASVIYMPAWSGA